MTFNIAIALFSLLILVLYFLSQSPVMVILFPSYVNSTSSSGLLLIDQDWVAIIGVYR